MPSLSRWSFGALCLALALTLAMPAVAQTDQASDKKKARNPNEMVCEQEEVLGSRLAGRRVCMTRAQWAEKRRDDRALIDRSQTQSCLKQAGC